MNLVRRLSGHRSGQKHKGEPKAEGREGLARVDD
jgi:hypothetical protein